MFTVCAYNLHKIDSYVSYCAAESHSNCSNINTNNEKDCII